jgi:nucleosome binding factor SPN SPT16 subunit
LQPDLVDVAYPPIFHSGGEYDFRMASGSDDKILHYGVITCMAGARWGLIVLLAH